MNANIYVCLTLYKKKGITHVRCCNKMIQAIFCVGCSDFDVSTGSALNLDYYEEKCHEFLVCTSLARGDSDRT